MPAEPTPTTVASRGVLHLIPVGLGEAPINDWLPHEAQALAGQLNTYIAENAKTARAFLKLTPLTHRTHPARRRRHITKLADTAA